MPGPIPSAGAWCQQAEYGMSALAAMPSTWGGPCWMPARMSAFRHFLDHLAAKGRQIIGLPTGHDPIVDHHFLIHPVCSGIFQISAYRRIGGHGAPFHNPCLDQYPRTVADGSDGLFGSIKLTDKLYRTFIDTQEIGIDLPPGIINPS